MFSQEMASFKEDIAPFTKSDSQDKKKIFHPWDTPEEFVQTPYSVFKTEKGMFYQKDVEFIFHSSVKESIQSTQMVGLEGFSNSNYTDTSAQVYDISKNFVEGEVVPIDFNEMKEKYDKEYFSSEYGITDEATETYVVTEWKCKGCNKYFTTKGSLNRHLERKKSCKQIVEKPVVAPAAPVAVELTKKEIPEKPYIVDWVDQLLYKAISGDTDKPTCKFCEIEFANKGNLNKHLSKSVACDKLAKEEFTKMISALSIK